MGVRQPAGVVVGIAPWNAPVILGTRAVATPLAYRQHRGPEGVRGLPAHARGDRPRARTTPACPPGVVNLVTHEPDDAADVVDELIAHPAVRRINFTGSTRVGRLWPRTRRATSSACCSSSAARRRWSCWPTPTWTRRWPPRSSARSCTRARSACRPSGSWSTARSRTTFAATLGERAAALKVGDPRDPDDPDRPAGERDGGRARGGPGRGRRRRRRRGGDRRRGRRRRCSRRPC